MPDFNGRWSCKLTDFGGKRLVDRGYIDFTGHIDAQGNVTAAPHQYREGSTVTDYTVNGSIKQTNGEWVLDLDRSDERAIYRGFLIEDDATRREMSFVARKFILQPITPDRVVTDRKAAIEVMRLSQVEEPWIITKP
jgi:hypothetical protein